MKYRSRRQRCPLREVKRRVGQADGFTRDYLSCGHVDLYRNGKRKPPSKRRCVDCGELEEMRAHRQAAREQEQDDWAMQDALGIAYPKD